MASVTLPEALRRAVTAYNDGKFSEAGRLCHAIIAAKPDLFDALRLLAVVQTKLGRLKDALTSYDHALALRPDHAPTLFRRGATVYELRRFEDALASYEKALIVRPDCHEALVNRGIALRELRRFDEALGNHERALIVRPNYPEALVNRGLALHELKRFDEALGSYERALIVRPNYHEALVSRGATLHELKRFDEALASYEKALIVRPDCHEALVNRGIALRELRRFDEALGNHERALIVRPNYPEALVNRGVALHELKCFDEALGSYERALIVRPNYPEALVNRGLVLHDSKRFKEALASFDRAITVRPSFAQAHVYEAFSRLLIGDFDGGLEKFEWRSNESKARFPQPMWRGSNKITGNTILIHSENWVGFGDMIQFCRYVPLVAERAARVVLEVQAPLQGLMSTLPAAPQIVAMGDPLPRFDMHCPLLSLPLAFKTRLETIPAATPYLRAAAQAVVNWNARLSGRGRPRIGLVWSSNKVYRIEKSISLRLLLPLMDVSATFVSLHLQKDVSAGDAAVLKARSDVLHFGDELNFSETAALISNLDLIISVDTSVAHLAGALAKPVWVLLPFIPDWRWLLDRNDSPWYPTARLFRQEDSRTWDSVIARVRAALQDFVRNYVLTRQRQHAHGEQRHP